MTEPGHRAAVAEALRAQIPADVLALCRRLRDAGHQAHLVGGGVRDMLLGRPPADFDVATDARPEAVLALFGTRFAIPTGLKHGTVTVLTDASAAPPVEVTTFRGEGDYLDGRRPSSVTYVDTLEEDLSRRDFTMNAIAFDPLDGRLTDPFDGRAISARRLIRAVGDPRAALPRGRPAPDARRAAGGAAGVRRSIRRRWRRSRRRSTSFRKVSAERIRDELFKMLAARAAVARAWS